MNHRQRFNLLRKGLEREGLLDDIGTTLSQSPESRQLHENTIQYLEKLKKFQQTSRKCRVVVGGDNCGYCHPKTLSHYPNYC